MIWNTKKIGFLHQPEYFLGSFDNSQMQARHEKELEKSLSELKMAISKESDPLKALKLLSPKDHLQFLMNNVAEFVKQNRYEETVLYLYLKANRPFSSGGDSSLWQKLFSDCDLTLLRQKGIPFPEDITRVYRGSVSGMQRSLAWTADLEMVKSFASRWQDPSLGGGHLYEVDMKAENVLVYYEQTIRRRVEKIAILDPAFIAIADIRSYQD